MIEAPCSFFTGYAIIYAVAPSAQLAGRAVVPGLWTKIALSSLSNLKNYTRDRMTIIIYASVKIILLALVVLGYNIMIGSIVIAIVIRFTSLIMPR